MNNLQFLEDKIAELKEQGVYRQLPVNTGPCANVIYLKGQEIVNLSSNNYLGFANHPRLIQAAKAATDKYGAGAGSVRTIVGNQDLLEELENLLALFKQEEAVTCFQSGFNCNLERFLPSPRPVI